MDSARRRLSRAPPGRRTASAANPDGPCRSGERTKTANLAAPPAAARCPVATGYRKPAQKQNKTRRIATPAPMVKGSRRSLPDRGTQKPRKAVSRGGRGGQQEGRASASPPRSPHPRRDPPFPHSGSSDQRKGRPRGSRPFLLCDGYQSQPRPAAGAHDSPRDHAAATAPPRQRAGRDAQPAPWFTSGIAGSARTRVSPRGRAPQGARTMRASRASAVPASPSWPQVPSPQHHSAGLPIRTPQVNRPPASTVAYSPT